MLVDRGQGLRYTYAELNTEVDLIARGLMARGIEKGDRVGVWSPTCAQDRHAARDGQDRRHPGQRELAYRVHELAYALNQSGMRVLVSATSFKTSDYAAMIPAESPQVPSLSDVVFLDGADWDRLRADSAAVGADALAARQATLANTDPINIQYTRGQIHSRAARCRTATS